MKYYMFDKERKKEMEAVLLLSNAKALTTPRERFRTF